MKAGEGRGQTTFMSTTSMALRLEGLVKEEAAGLGMAPDPLAYGHICHYYMSVIHGKRIQNKWGIVKSLPLT